MNVIVRILLLCFRVLPPSLLSLLCRWFHFFLFQTVHFDRHDIGKRFMKCASILLIDHRTDLSFKSGNAYQTYGLTLEFASFRCVCSV